MITARKEDDRVFPRLSAVRGMVQNNVTVLATAREEIKLTVVHEKLSPERLFDIGEVAPGAASIFGPKDPGEAVRAASSK